MKRNCNMMIVEYLRKHDRLTKKLERTRIEKNTIEKLLKTYLSEATE